MERTGIRRKIDDLGRVVIPSSMRRTLGIREGDELDIAVDGDRLLLRRAADRCTFCGTEEYLDEFRGKAVCWSCSAAIRALDRAREARPANPFGV